MKCLDKERSRRYRTANDLAGELQRFLRCEPILTRPAGSWERGSKRVKKRKKEVAFFLIGGLAALAIMISVLVLLRSEKQSNAAGMAAEIPQPPEINFSEPTDNETFSDGLIVKFEVKTLTPLKKLVFFVNDVPFNPRVRDPHSQPNTYEVRAELKPGPNHLRVEAANLSAETEKKLSVKRNAIPLRTRFVSEIPRVVPSSSLTVRGHFTIETDAISNELRTRGFDRFKPDKFAAVVFVNGFRQAPVKMSFPAEDDRWCEFEAEMVLNQAKENKIHFRFVPQVYLPLNFVMDCANPLRTRNLYLLIAAPGLKDGEKLRDRVLKALRAHKEKEVISSKVFERIYTFSLTDQVTPDLVYQNLREIYNSIKKRGSPNDIVIVYFCGQETVDGQGHFFRTSASRDDPELQRSAITCDGLSAYFEEVMGAKLLILDVLRTYAPTPLSAGEAVDRIARWPEFDRSLGIMRCLWRQRAPIHGCILALEGEANSTRKMSLSDLETSVDRLFHEYPEFGVFDMRFPEELRRLILWEQP
jgi:hypothetical protein